MSRTTTRALVIALSTAVLVGLAATPALAQVTPGTLVLSTRSSSVFKLQPNKDRVQATVKLTVKNRTPDFAFTRYYTDQYPVLIQRGARKVRVAGKGTKIRRVQKGEQADVYRVEFPRIFKGQSRSVRITYELAAAGPGSERLTRITKAYSHFCFHGQPTDKSSVTAYLPRSHRPDTVSKRLKAKDQGGLTKITPKGKKQARGLHCVESSHPHRLLSETVTTGQGSEVVVEAWPEDPDWLTQVSEQVDVALPFLESWTGSALGGRVSVRQSARQALGDYAGTFDSRGDTIRIGESADDPMVVAHEMAHAWFNRTTMGETWMSEGSAEWAARSAHGLWCDDPSRVPADARVGLDEWHYLGIEADELDHARVSYQYAASCWINQEVARAMGFDRYVAVNRALLERTPKYGGQAPTKTHVPDWREWLDAVDEVGLVPAGVQDLELAEQLLVEFGVASADELEGRSSARSYYHAALEAWAEYMPLVVRHQMDDWRFAEASASMDLVSAIIDDLNLVSHQLDPVTAADLLGRMADATTPGELDALKQETAALA